MCGYSGGLSCFSSPPPPGTKEKGVEEQESGKRNVSLPATHASLPPTSPRQARSGLRKREVGGHGPRLLCLLPLETFYYRRGEASESDFPRGQQLVPLLFF